MNKSGFPQFQHRHNSDGSIDSICLSCFRTAATGSNPRELASAEAAHVCGRPGTGWRIVGR